MIMKTLLPLVLSLLFLSSFSGFKSVHDRSAQRGRSHENPAARVVQLHFSSIRNMKGQIQLGVYRNQQEFKEEKPYQTHIFPKKNLKDGSMTAELSLPDGVYGISVLDDENANKKMDYNFLGMPEEGFGFSDFYLSGFSRPVFEDFDFQLNGKAKAVKIKFRYI
jgi:uncharacterized protein (DUF2141 family)